jgi:hypothetical protein
MKYFIKFHEHEISLDFSGIFHETLKFHEIVMKIFITSWNDFRQGRYAICCTMAIWTTRTFQKTIEGFSKMRVKEKLGIFYRAFCY